MHIAVVGAGAIGLLVTKLLEDSGHSVVVYSRSEKSFPVLYQSPEGSVELVSFMGTQDTTLLNEVDLVFVATKTYHLESVYPLLHNRTGPIVFLQNGLIRKQVEAALGKDYCLFGSIDHGAGIEEDLLVHTGNGSIRVGDNPLYEPFIKQLAPVVSWTDDIDRVLMRKAVLNTLINPLTALLDVPNGDLAVNDSLQQAVITHYDELVVAFPTLEDYLPLEEVFELIKRTSTNSSSMRRDIKADRETEISAIVLPLLEQAEARNAYLPITSYLYSMIQSKKE